MKLFVVLSCLVAVAVAASPTPQPSVSRAFLRGLPAIHHEEVHDEYGQYAFRYVTADHTVRTERGYLKKASNGHVIMVIEGEYQYIDEYGKLFSRKYKGDEYGFHVDSTFKPEPYNADEQASLPPLEAPKPYDASA